MEERLRELLTERTGAIRPDEAPVDDIVRRGRNGRRLRVAVTASALAVAVAVPVGAYAVGPGSGDDAPAAKRPSPTKVAAPPARTTPEPTPPGPQPPASSGQLVDGITFEEAADGLEKCLGRHEEGERASTEESMTTDLGKPEDYRILLAHRKTGDDNAPDDGIWVVATTEQPVPRPNRVICGIKGDEVTAINSGAGPLLPEEGPVYSDLNGGKLYKQNIFTSDGWRLPFRWGNIGQVTSEVDRVTVTYGGETVEAAVDHGWFAATGVVEEQPATAPRIKGYDAKGKQIYDSAQDKNYEPGLPKG
ncbi:hypothetical protein G6045_16520 [Streptomyces sp. YC504]|uniref:Uncharacterized protein n=1 Tax=Streptomyces mesophilus TaxID=1775132 RepID=A0A6G4XK88_9ACTN|nr:hypothetical protein [Streptomyces mesophilus]